MLCKAIGVLSYIKTLQGLKRLNVSMVAMGARVQLLRYCRNVRPTWVKFNSKDTKESEWCSRF